MIRPLVVILACAAAPYICLSVFQFHFLSFLPLFLRPGIG